MSINRSTSNYINLKIVKMETKEFKETPIRCDLRQAFIVHNFEELEEIEEVITPASGTIGCCQKLCMEQLKLLKGGMKMEINFDEMSFEDLEEIEEVITPGSGTIGCC